MQRWNGRWNMTRICLYRLGECTKHTTQDKLKRLIWCWAFGWHSLMSFSNWKPKLSRKIKIENDQNQLQMANISPITTNIFVMLNTHVSTYINYFHSFHSSARYLRAHVKCIHIENKVKQNDRQNENRDRKTVLLIKCFSFGCVTLFFAFWLVRLLLPFREKRTDVREKILLFALA